MHNKHLLAAVLLSASATLCAQENFEIGNPNDANYAYLKNYAAIKDYVDRAKYPNFKIGLSVESPDYNNKGIVYRLTNKNFDEVVSGNAMKMASCVDNSGNMNFSTVRAFVNNATDAGLAVYGHTLAWHSQQPGGWLNSLIKDKPAEPIPGADTPVLVEKAAKDFRTSQSVGWTSDQTAFGYSIKFDGTDGMTVTTTKKTDNNWDVQYLAMTDIPTEKGKTYTATLTVKGSAEGKMNVKLGDWGSGPAHEVAFSTDWQDINVEFSDCLSGSFLMLQHGHFVGTLKVRKIVIKEQVMGKTVKDDTRCIMVDATAKTSDVWDNQFWLITDGFQAGDKYEFSARVRASYKAKASTQIHNAPGSYVDWQAIGDIPFTDEWQTVTSAGSFTSAGKSIAFNLSEYAGANSYYLTELSLKVNGVEKLRNGSLKDTDVSSFSQKTNSGAAVSPTISDGITYVLLPQPVPMPLEEKREALIAAMDKWISGMMEACEGKVKAWDVVNEAIAGGGSDSEGVYPLQHDNGSGDFFWQDHMGDLDYVRNACRIARKYGPEGMTLFINDYNLESEWDDNGKLKSLIKWIERWEADGVTHIDGIGSQMHINCYMNDATQNAKKRGIENSLKLMAATGKLVRISELDMGMVNSAGEEVPTDKVNETMHKRMADLYAWIIKKYLEIVPVEQQWGVCQWCATDAPSSSGWRANNPVGLWTLNTFYRKHAYAGFCQGLGAPTPAAITSATQDARPSDCRTYTLSGQLMASGSPLTAGIYIKEGKKVVR